MQQSANFIVLAALIGELGFMAINILAKRLRNAGVSSRAVLACYGLSLPVWVAGLCYFAGTGQIHLPWPYLLCLAAWLAVCYGMNFGTVFISAFQSLSEGTGYRFGFSVMIALLADVVIFHTAFHPAVIVSIAMLFAGGIVLHLNRVKMDLHSSKLVKLRYKIGFVFLVSLAEVATYALFKYAAGMQDNVLAHNAMFQTPLLIIFLAMGGRVMANDVRQGYMPLPFIAGIAVLLLVAASADAVAMAGLPVTLFIMFSLIRAACFAVHDIRSGEVPFTPMTVAAIALIAGGVVSTAFIHHLG